MTAITIFIGIIIGLNCIPLLTKRTFPKAEKLIYIILIASIVMFLTFAIFDFKGYRLKGFYTFAIIGWAFIIATVAYFIIVKNSKKKILTAFFLTPLIVLNIFTLLFRQHTYEHRIDEITKISVTTGGFLACGEILNITQTRFVIFDKEVFHIGDLCLIGISKIETVKLNDKQADFLIYHNGQHDSENPYKYNVERKNRW